MAFDQKLRISHNILGHAENHLEKLSMVLTRLQDAGLRINADKSNFCRLETEYPRVVRTYLDDLLIITKGSLEDHLEKLSMVLTRLQDAGLKINADRSNFCTLETEYLGYKLTRDGIKPQPNKVQVMLALAPPENIKELCRFLGMDQYYRDLLGKMQ